MKQYRLLKEVLNYSTGHVIAPGEIFEQMPNSNHTYVSKNGWYMDIRAIELPTWFEEIIQNKDWEIVEFGMTKSYGLIGPSNFILESDGKYHGVRGISKDYHELIGHPDVEIRSVRRLSDGEVFSVGDEVGYDNGNIRTKQDWKIDHFFIREADNVLLARSKDCSNVELVDKWLYKSLPSNKQEPKEGFKDWSFVKSYSFGLIDNRTDPPTIYYTQEQLDKAIEDAFNAARVQDYFNPKWETVSETVKKWDSRKYPTLQDYLKTLQ